MPVTSRLAKSPRQRAARQNGNGCCRHPELPERCRAGTPPTAATWKASARVAPQTRAATDPIGKTVSSTPRAPPPWIEDAEIFHSSPNITRPHSRQIPCSQPVAYYYVVVTASTPVAQGAYNWSAASNPALGNNGWGGGIYDYSTDGSTWDYSRDHFFQFAVNATAVPEPSIVALFSLGSVALVWALRRRTRKGYRHSASNMTVRPCCSPLRFTSRPM